MSAPDHDGLVRCAECDGHGCAECGGLGEVLREGLNGEPKAPEGATQPISAGHLARVREAINTNDLLDPWDDAPALLADRDRLAAEVIKLRNELSCERGDCERALAIVDSVKAELGDQDLEGEDIWAAVQELRERAEAGS